ncbi:MAG TPA: hypothetical protein VLC95_13055 [Anaerolineae bacterium]|nr:hypothetical protein [Anaerolineae bacterium]
MINRTVGRQALFLLMAAVVVYMGAGFVRQTLVGRQQREVLDDVESQIDVALQEGESLRAQLEYGLSPQAAEEWARENGWGRTDEQIVIVVAPPADPAASEEEASGQPLTPESRRSTWWDLFFSEH